MSDAVITLVTVAKVEGDYGYEARVGWSKCATPDQLTIIEAVLSGEIDDYAIEDVGEIEKHVHVDAYISKPEPAGNNPATPVACPNCGGSGDTGDEGYESQCKHCHGKGEV